jgi:hypothetical protein
MMSWCCLPCPGQLLAGVWRIRPRLPRPIGCLWCAADVSEWRNIAWLAVAWSSYDEFQAWRALFMDTAAVRACGLEFR